MNEKRKAIIEQGMILFATKGFHFTSMQEIAEHAGVSKGGVYIYFSSKNELLLEIYRYYYQKMKEKIKPTENMNSLPAKERLQYQINVYIEELLSQKEFIMMHFYESVSHSHELEEFIHSVKRDTFKWYRESLLNIYGERILPYITDLSIIVKGIIESYLLTLFSTNTSLAIDKLAAFIISRLDDLVEGMVQKQEAPPFEMDLLTNHLTSNHNLRREQLQILLTQLEEIITDIELDNGLRKDCMDSITILKEEANQENPKKVVFQGLLNILNEIPGTHHLSRKILALFINTDV